MAKKIRAKDKRAAKQAARQQEINQNQQKRDQEIAAQLAAQEAEKERQAAAKEKKYADGLKAAAQANGEQKKSGAKAAGLKSAVYLDDEHLLLVGFGRGNEARLSKRVDGDVIKDVSAEPEDFQAEWDSQQVKQFLLTSKRGQGSRNDPRHSSEKNSSGQRVPGEDLLRFKSKLEIRYFGKEYQDNIHIQIAHRIQKLEKILAVYINNIIYQLESIWGEEDGIDTIGYVNIGYVYDEKLGKRIQEYFEDSQKRNGYFGSAFIDVGTDKKAPLKSERRPEEAFRTILGLLGFVRNVTAHGEGGATGRLGSELYTIERNTDRKPEKNRNVIYQVSWDNARKLLSDTYDDRVNSINSKFYERNKKNLTILFRVLGADTTDRKQSITESFYRFTVEKTVKNLGFSIKQIRENMLEMRDATDDDGNHVRTSVLYDSTRSKLNTLFDFILYSYYQDHPERMDSLIAMLRAAEYESMKEAFYKREAKEAWKDIREQFSALVRYMKGSVIKDLIVDPDITETMFADVQYNPAGTSYYSKLIYLLTLFLDGKEINMLLTQLISGFENIAAFLTISPECTADQFTDEFKMFGNSQKIANELRLILSFARMSLPDASAKVSMFIDAAKMLGTNSTDAELETYFKALLDKNNVEKGSKKNNGLRNFIASNVISSRRFIYLIRYSNPETVRAILQNNAIVLFVLKDIPDEQVIAYYNTCHFGQDAATDPDEMRNELAEIISSVNFAEFEDAAQYQLAQTEEQKARKTQQQQIIRLYLTVGYLVVKNLVNVNSRYYHAIHCLERDLQIATGDRELLIGKSREKGKDKEKGSNCFNLVAAFIDEDAHLLNAHATKILRTNYDKYKNDKNDKNDTKDNKYPDKVFIAYRNTIEHLNTVRSVQMYIPEVKQITSYFGLYHYLIQRYLYDHRERFSDNCSEAIKVLLKKAVENGTACKDLIKVLNVPFGYNLPRYKNLSIDELFDKDRPGELRPGNEPDHLDALNPEVLPSVLYHGTMVRAEILQKILREGLQPVNHGDQRPKHPNRYVRLTKNLDEAAKARKNGKFPTVLKIDTKKVLEQGGTFYWEHAAGDSLNTWMIESVPANCITVIDNPNLNNAT